MTRRTSIPLAIAVLLLTGNPVALRAGTIPYPDTGIENVLEYTLHIHRHRRR
jgi:hypothetical protein